MYFLRLNFQEHRQLYPQIVALSPEESTLRSFIDVALEKTCLFFEKTSMQHKCNIDESSIISLQSLKIATDYSLL